MPISTIHPFIVHFALSFVLLAAMMEAMPGVRARIPQNGQTLIWRCTLISVFLAVLTGWLSFYTLENRFSPLPRIAGLHRLGGIAGLGLLLILRAIKEESGPGRTDRPLSQSGLKKTFALAILLVFLATATMGGHLVYHNHLGTDFWSKSDPGTP